MMVVVKIIMMVVAKMIMMVMVKMIHIAADLALPNEHAVKLRLSDVLGEAPHHHLGLFL